MANIYTDIKLFDAEYYLANNADVAAAIEGTDVTAQDHYFLHGAAENRAPNSWFNAAEYVAQNPDLADVDANLLLAHFALHGVNEGRAPNAATAGADGKIKSELLADYVNAEGNEDVKAAIAEITGAPVGAELTAEQAAIAAQHFFNYGINEDRKGGIADVIAEGEGSEGEGLTETFTLTEGRDTVIGTENDDTIVGFVGQNQNGAVSNAFATGDYIDGGAGRDKIVATIINDGTVDDGTTSTINARTVNVEEAHFEALKSFGGDTVTVDAGRMDSVQEFWSDNSSADLRIEDVRLGSKLSITKDITFGLRDTDFDTEFTALFDSPSLRAAPDTQSNSSLVIQIADVSTETIETPLANVNLNLSFDLGTETVSLDGVRSTDGTYAGLVAALRTALEDAGYADVNVQLTTPYNTVTFAGNTVTLPFTAQEILLTDPAGNAFSAVNFTQSAIEPVAGGFLVAGNAAPADPTQTSNLIESNLELDHAGRGSLAGDVVIGGMSNSGKGVEKFNVTVDRDSKIEGLYTTNDTLREIEIKSQGANGSLRIGGTQADLVEIDANAFAGEALSLGQGREDYDGGVADPIANLRNLDAGQTAANVWFVADYNGTGLGSGDAQAFVANTGSGDDFITASVVGESNSGSTVTSLSINAGNGNNTIVLSSDNGDAIDNTAIVITGSGADVITGGAVSLTVDAGAGNDVIYAENTGDRTVAQLDAGVFEAVVGDTTSGSPTTFTIDNIQLLHGRTAVVTLGLSDNTVVGAYTQGLEVSFTVNASSGVLTTERDLYQAAADAINGDAVLNKLAGASVDSNGNLIVTYKIDGETIVGDDIVKIEVVDNFATTPLSAAQISALKAEYSNSSITTFTPTLAGDEAFAEVTAVGTDSLNGGGTNVITGGLGDDVIVLSSSAVAKSDTVVFDAGQFGNDTIVHFTAGATDGDVLDFSAWLNNQTSASGSVESRVDVGITLNGDTTVTANEVTVLDFNNLFNPAGTVTFDNMTDAQVQAALNAWGTVGTTTDLVGTTQFSLLLVENDGNTVAGFNDNQGEYKVYQVSSNNTATVSGDDGDFTVQLVGSLDFGAEQSFTVENFAV